MIIRVAFCLVGFLSCSLSLANEPVDLWPNLAPGETTRHAGKAMPARPEEIPTVTRVVDITQPTFTVHKPDKSNGAAVVILPGGGFSKVVPDKEGSEAAAWLCQHGFTCFVLSYRTTADPNKSPGWLKPLQDAQRMLALVRFDAQRWGVRPDRVGLLGFSAGGQVAARLLCDGGKLEYQPLDAIDRVSHRPDFALLVYPWNIYDNQSGKLIEGILVPKDCPPTFLVHTHDDRSSSLGATLFYVGLKQHNVAGELHVYGNGGHGYGTRPVEGSQISSWTTHAAHWLQTPGILQP